MNKSACRAGATAAAAALTLAACSSSGGGGATDAVHVLASIYPLQYVAETVGGDNVEVDSLTPPGVDAHDLELAPRDVAELGDAGVVLYLSGFQAAVDDAVAQASPAHALDVAGLAGTAGAATDAHAEDEAHTEEGSHAEDEAHTEEGSHAEAESQDADAHDHSGDPHFWLDPTRLAAVATGVADELAEVDPGNADEYRANAEKLAGELAALDGELADGLAACEVRTIVVAHEAYGYLTERYDLEQVGVSGIDPESEPSPARLAEVAEVVRAEGVSTIFAETLVNPEVAETLADDLGIAVSMLDPLDSQLNEDLDYQEVMRANLAALRDGLRCA
ncbi:metal ABC transporter substrate-binding protein [Georgenia sp. AZ-5]|uniref:metal ABC transporter substrate-binding protein n=1 Tax=Georgenia sp. AZ-5 TaxID=3367526 RepID=UPI003754EB10